MKQSLGQQILQVLISNVPDMIFAKDKEGRYVFNNPYTAEFLTGDKNSNIQGKTSFDFYPTSVAEQLTADEEEIIRSENPQIGLERSIIDPFGHQCWLSITKIPWYDDEGKIVGIIGINRNITENKFQAATISQKNFEVALLYEAGHQISRSLDVNKVYDALYNLVTRVMKCDSLIVSSYNAKEQIIYCEYANLKGARLNAQDLPPIPLEPEGFGIQSIAIRSGKPSLISNYPERLKSTQINYFFDENGIYQEELPEDEERPRSALIVPIILEGDVIGVIQVFCNQLNAYTPDHLHLLEAFASQVAVASTNARLYTQAQTEIIERRTAEQALRAMAEENARLAEVRSNLLQEVNHRVKNNLSSILGLLEMEINRPKEEQQNIEDLLRTLQERILGMAYVHNLLSSVQWAPLQIRSLVDHIIKAVLSNSSLQHKVNLSLETEPENIAIIPRQATALALIVNELTMNSVKYALRDMKDGKISVNIRLMKEEKHPTVKLVFQDNGPGWPEDVMEGKRSGVGLEVIRLSIQSPLNGRLNLYNDSGAVAELNFHLAVNVNGNSKG